MAYLIRSSRDVISLLEDGDDDDMVNRNDRDAAHEVTNLLQRSLRLPAHAIDLTGIDEEEEEKYEIAFEKGLAMLSDTGSEDDYPTPEPDNFAFNARASSANFVILPTCEVPGSLPLMKNKVVEVGFSFSVDRRVNELPVNFVKIHEIKKDVVTGQVILSCAAYTRAANLGGLLPCKLNEVVQIIQCNESALATRSLEEQSLYDVPLEHISPVKRTLRTTNALFPDHRYSRQSLKMKGGMSWVRENSELVCRWVMTYFYSNEKMKAKREPCEYVLTHVREEDADMDLRVPEDTKLNVWRGGKTPGGAHCPGSRHGADVVVDLESENEMPVKPKGPKHHGQTYQVRDFFAGCGGVSRGMTQAGMKVAIAVDHWKPACDSYARNFPQTKLYREDISEYLTRKQLPEYKRLDIVHLSPPCQVWSPAHTSEGKNDDANMAALFACRGIIEKHKPRLFTLEQTFGILVREHCKVFLRALVQCFTEQNYSVRWKLMYFPDYGLAQTRKRLVMIGAAPGEKLPTFPEKTHSKSPSSEAKRGYKPYVTVAGACAGLRDGMHLHDPSKQTTLNKEPWDPNGQHSRTITCGGGENYHWSGKRQFTLREFATLQGFPFEHQFLAPEQRKQIGNAFPPCVVRVIYEHLASFLDKADGFDPVVCRRQRTAGYADQKGAVDLTGRRKRTRRSRDQSEDDDDGTPTKRFQGMRLTDEPVVVNDSDDEGPVVIDDEDDEDLQIVLARSVCDI